MMHFTQSAYAYGVSINWNKNSESDVAGYKVYYGTATHNYQNMLDVGPFTAAVIDGLSGGVTYYFAVTAYDTLGNESGVSQEVLATMPTAPVISCSTTSLTNSCAQGNNASSRTLQVWNSGTGTLNYNASTNQSWITCAQPSGSSTGISDKKTLSFNYSASNLAPGVYTATITISSSGASNTPQTIPVTLTVLPPTIAPSPTSLTLTITKAGTGTGTVTSSPTGTTFSAGTTVTLTATPNSNSTFAGWSGGCSGSLTTKCTVIMNSNISGSAAFNLKTYTITASAGTGGSISPSGSNSVNSGSYKTFIITPGTGYSTGSVKIDGISISPITSYTFNNINANHTISASFIRRIKYHH